MGLVNYTNLYDYFTSSNEEDAITDAINDAVFNKEEKKMDNGFMKNMFGSVKKGLCRLTMEGNIAVKTSTGYKSYDAAQGNFVNCDNFCFDIGDEMFFVVPTNDVQIGDIILAAGKPKYVLKNEANMITVINYENGVVEQILPERHIFMGNTYFYGKIVSMFGNVTSGGADNIMKYMMLTQFMKNGDGMSNMGMNPMLMLMMSNGNNIFDGIFNTNKDKEVK